MKPKLDSALAEVEEEMKARRKERGLAAERSIQRSLRDRSLDAGDRAEDALRAFGRKVMDDLDEQFAYVEQLRDSVPITPNKYAELEVSRLLRMLERRKEMIDRIQSAMMLREDLAVRLAEFGYMQQSVEGNDAHKMN